MARDFQCDHSHGLYEDPIRCANKAWPCYNSAERYCTNKDGTEIMPNCPEGQQAERVLCANNWPDFPCYNQRERACYSLKGEQLFDPLGDITFGAYSMLDKTARFISSLLTDKKLNQDPHIEAKLYDHINGYWSSYASIAKADLPQYLTTLENIRPISDKEKIIANTSETISKVDKLLRKAGQKMKTRKTRRKQRTLKRKHTYRKKRKHTYRKKRKHTYRKKRKYKT